MPDISKIKIITIVEEDDSEKEELENEDNQEA